MWDVFANQNENFDSFATHSLLSLAEKVDQSGIKSVINLFKSMHEKIQENTKLSAFTRPVNPVFYSISEDEDFVKQCKFFSWKVDISYSSIKQLVFCYKIVLTYCEKKIVLVIKKNI